MGTMKIISSTKILGENVLMILSTPTQPQDFLLYLPVLSQSLSAVDARIPTTPRPLTQENSFNPPDACLQGLEDVGSWVLLVPRQPYESPRGGNAATPRLEANAIPILAPNIFSTP